jgi:type III secretory pathway lipoprotein EscJ
LADVGIESEKVKQADGSWALAVDSASSVPALRAVSDARLLRNEDAAPLEKSSLMSSREDQRFRFERALARELEQTLNNVPAVLESRVHLNLPMVDPLFGQKMDSSPGSASVLLVVTSDAVSRTDVASIVAGASGIPFKDISIMVSVSEPKPRQAAALPPFAPSASPELSQSGILPVTPRSEVAWYEQHRGMALQVAASLVIAGVGLALYLLRRKRKAEVFIYEAHQPL